MGSRQCVQLVVRDATRPNNPSVRRLREPGVFFFSGQLRVKVPYSMSVRSRKQKATSCLNDGVGSWPRRVRDVDGMQP